MNHLQRRLQQPLTRALTSSYHGGGVGHYCHRHAVSRFVFLSAGELPSSTPSIYLGGQRMASSTSSSSNNNRNNRNSENNKTETESVATETTTNTAAASTPTPTAAVDYPHTGVVVVAVDASHHHNDDKVKPRNNNNNNNNNKYKYKNDDMMVFERTEYVHPLSQLILEYLQETHHDWIVAKGLDQALKIHRDGSFALQRRLDLDPTTAAATTTTTTTSTTPTPTPTLSIWTFYEDVEKKHWLVARHVDREERFLLQDNLASSWNTNHRRSLPERIHTAVNQMIHALDQMAMMPSTSSRRSSHRPIPKAAQAQQRQQQRRTK